jgi:hypothetical protein
MFHLKILATAMCRITQAIHIYNLITIRATVAAVRDVLGHVTRAHTARGAVSCTVNIQAGFDGWLRRTGNDRS